MVFLIDEAGVSSYVGPVAAAPGEAELPLPDAAFSTSSFVMVPPRPVPLSEPMATPFSRASFLAAGEMLGCLSRDVSRRKPAESDS
jgi:hypothetical protein